MSDDEDNGLTLYQVSERLDQVSMRVDQVSQDVSEIRVVAESAAEAANENSRLVKEHTDRMEQYMIPLQRIAMMADDISVLGRAGDILRRTFTSTPVKLIAGFGVLAMVAAKGDVAEAKNIAKSLFHLVFGH